LRDISGKLREVRKTQLKILIGNYEKALGKAKEDNKKGIEILLAKAKQELKDLK
jgi:hypothetical protein